MVNFIAEARERVGLSQVELAEKLGVAPSTVAGWELLPDSGHSFRLARLDDVARVLKVSKKDLLAWWMEMQLEEKAS